MARFFEPEDPLTEPVACVLLVEGHARAEHIDQRKPRIGDGIRIELQKVLGLAAESTRDIAAAGGQRERQRVEHALQVSVEVVLVRMPGSLVGDTARSSGHRLRCP